MVRHELPLIGAVLVVASVGAADAAVRVCRPPVSSGIATDAVERAARAKAIASWTVKARLAGTPNPTWRIAAKKFLRCAKVGSGQFDCIALAQPCTIAQSPPRSLPPGPGPAKPGKDKDKPIST